LLTQLGRDRQTVDMQLVSDKSALHHKPRQTIKFTMRLLLHTFYTTLLSCFKRNPLLDSRQLFTWNLPKQTDNRIHKTYSSRFYWQKWKQRAETQTKYTAVKLQKYSKHL